MIDSFIYFYQLDEFFTIPVTPENLANTYQSKFNLEEIMNRTAQKPTYSGTNGRVLAVDLTLHSQLFALDNPKKPSITKDLIKAFSACSYPNFDFENSKIIPPGVLIKFGEAATIRGVISTGVTCTLGEPWLKDGTLAMAKISFSITETDQYSADYIRKFGTRIPIPTDLERRRIR